MSLCSNSHALSVEMACVGKLRRSSDISSSRLCNLLGAGTDAVANDGWGRTGSWRSWDDASHASWSKPVKALDLCSAGDDDSIGMGMACVIKGTAIDEVESVGVSARGDRSCAVVVVESDESGCPMVVGNVGRLKEGIKPVPGIMGGMAEVGSSGGTSPDSGGNGLPIMNGLPKNGGSEDKDVTGPRVGWAPNMGGAFRNT